MKFLGPFALLATLLLAVFAIANWSVLSTPGDVSFLAFSIQAPMGVIMLAITLVFMGLFLLYALSQRTAMLLEARRHAHELQTQRELADRAEASRLAELRTQLDQEFEKLRASLQGSEERLNQRIDASEQSLLQNLEETGNSLNAYLGMLDEKMGQRKQTDV